jgi:hypothetical protein
VLPLMTANVALAVLLLIEDAQVGTIANAALASGIFAATGLVFAPLHGRLTQAGVVRLVRLNWLRTAGWTAQVAVAVTLV